MAPFCVVVRLLLIGLTVFDNVVCRPNTHENGNIYPTTDVISAEFKDTKNAVQEDSRTNCEKSKDGSSSICNDEQLTEEEQQAVLEHYMPLFSTLLRIHISKNVQHKLKVDSPKNNSDCDEQEKKEVSEKFWNKLLLLLHSIWPYRELTQVLPNDEYISKDMVISKIFPLQPNRNNEIQEKLIHRTNYSSKPIAIEEKTNMENEEDADEVTINLSVPPNESNEKLLATGTTSDTPVNLDILQDMDDLIQETINNQRIKSRQTTKSLKRRISKDINKYLEPLPSASKQKNKSKSIHKQTLEPHAEERLVKAAKDPNRDSNPDQKESHGQEVSGLKANKSLMAESFQNDPNKVSVHSHPSEENEKKKMMSRSVEDNKHSTEENETPNLNLQKIKNSKDYDQEILLKDNSEDNIQDSTQSSQKPNATSSTRHPIIKSEHASSGKEGIPTNESACLKFLYLLLRRMAQEETMQNKKTI